MVECKEWVKVVSRLTAVAILNTNLLHLAKTIYGEVRGESVETMLAVGWVVRNRLDAKRYGDTYKDVVLQPKQFSCWNKDDPNYEVIQGKIKGRLWEVCIGVAIVVMQSAGKHNPVVGVCHYYDKSMDSNPPYWAKGGELVAVYGVNNLRLIKGVK
jgi:spore germination cell wall hydrolase CwlJ-like protein